MAVELTVRKVIVIALIAFAALAAAVVLPFVIAAGYEVVDSVQGRCSDGELRVFREFPQYGGRQVEPEYSSSNGCFVALKTGDQPEQVRAYYTEQLTAHGWKIDAPPPPVEGGEGQAEAGGLNANRGSYGHVVLLEPAEGRTSVVVYVIERDE
jgi:hypothetical protein